MTSKEIQKAILEKSKDIARKKAEIEISRIKEAETSEVTLIEETMKEITNGFWLKKICNEKYGWQVKEYVVVTEEIFMKDYLDSLEEENSWFKGIHNKKSDSMNVGKYEYFHIGYIIDKFEKDVSEYRNILNSKYIEFTQMQKNFNNILKTLKSKKKAILDYQSKAKK